MRRFFQASRSAVVGALLATALALGGCVVNTSGGNGEPASDASGTPLIEQPASSPPLSNDAVPAPPGNAPGDVDFTCTTDAECAPNGANADEGLFTGSCSGTCRFPCGVGTDCLSGMCNVSGYCQ